MATLYLTDIRRVQPKGPYQLSGYSFGGVVAFEIARQLKEQGEEVAVLALLDTFNPGFFEHLPFARAVQFRLTYLADRTYKYAQKVFRGQWKDLYDTVQDRISWRTREIAWKLQGKHAQPPKPAQAEEIRDSVIMLADIGWAYVPKSYPGRLFLFAALEREPEYAIDKNYGWGGIVKEGVFVQKLAGTHFSLLEEPRVRELAAVLGE